MGDRGNIKVFQRAGHSEPVVIYSHWAGSELPEMVQTALAKKWRWDDPAYLTRIIYDECVGTDFGTESGWGITTYVMDENHPDLVVDPYSQAVTYGDHKWSFDEFIALEEIPRR